jgi:hypothetical protein
MNIENAKASQVKKHSQKQSKKTQISTNDPRFESILPCNNCNQCWFCLLANSTMVDYRYLERSAPQPQPKQDKTDSTLSISDQNHPSEYNLGAAYHAHLPDIILKYRDQQEHYVQSFFHAQTIADHRSQRQLREQQQKTILLEQQRQQQAQFATVTGQFSFSQGRRFSDALALQIDSASSEALYQAISPRQFDGALMSPTATVSSGQVSHRSGLNTGPSAIPASQGHNSFFGSHNVSIPDSAASSANTNDTTKGFEQDLRGIGDPDLNSLIDGMLVLQNNQANRSSLTPLPTLAQQQGRAAAPPRRTPGASTLSGQGRKPGGLVVTTFDDNDSPAIGPLSPAPSDAMLRTTTLMINPFSSPVNRDFHESSDDDDDDGTYTFGVDTSKSFFQNKQQLKGDKQLVHYDRSKTPQHINSQNRQPGSLTSHHTHSTTDAGSNSSRPPETPKSKGLMSKIFKKEH